MSSYFFALGTKLARASKSLPVLSLSGGGPGTRTAVAASHTQVMSHRIDDAPHYCCTQPAVASHTSYNTDDASHHSTVPYISHYSTGGSLHCCWLVGQLLHMSLEGYHVLHRDGTAAPIADLPPLSPPQPAPPPPPPAPGAPPECLLEGLDPCLQVERSLHLRVTRLAHTPPAGPQPVHAIGDQQLVKGGQALVMASSGISNGTHGHYRISDGTQGISDGTQGISDGTQGISKGTQGISDDTQGISDDMQGISDDMQGQRCPASRPAGATPGRPAKHTGSRSGVPQCGVGCNAMCPPAGWRGERACGTLLCERRCRVQRMRRGVEGAACGQVCGVARYVVWWGRPVARHVVWRSCCAACGSVLCGAVAGRVLRGAWCVVLVVWCGAVHLPAPGRKGPDFQGFRVLAFLGL